MKFKTRKQLEEQIDAQAVEIAEHDAAIEASNQRVTDAEAAQETAVAERDSAIAERDSAQEDLTAAQERNTELETENARIPELEAAATPEAIALAASRQLAASGHSVVGDVPEGAAGTPDVWAKYEAIEDKGERAKFWRDNEEALKASARK